MKEYSNPRLISTFYTKKSHNQHTVSLFPADIRISPRTQRGPFYAAN